MTESETRKNLISGWVFDESEISAGMYRVTGHDQDGRNVSRTGTDPDSLLLQCDRDAIELSGRAADEPERSRDFNDREH